MNRDAVLIAIARHLPELSKLGYDPERWAFTDKVAYVYAVPGVIQSRIEFRPAMDAFFLPEWPPSWGAPLTATEAFEAALACGRMDPETRLTHAVLYG